MQKNGNFTFPNEHFLQVDHGAKKIVNREKIRESIHKMHLDMAAQKERDDQEKMVANSLKREEDFRKLASENETLKAELTKVKSRYKVRELQMLLSHNSCPI